ncbi:MAG: Gfo/Idh/MocA family oxidoreductase [Planctomycetota bacterium]|nr:Gfo/Idh/MocA family oxidoreductase [Planctomycetota bacterium]
MTRVAIAGAGQWGRNHVRTLAGLPGATLAWVVDPDPARLEAAALLAPRARCTQDLEEALADPRVDALVIASPGPTHHEVARAGIAAGKHVLVEKPLTPCVATSRDLVRRARKAGVLLGVGHILVHHPAVQAMARATKARGFGAIRYIHATRTNLGRIRSDEGALASLAPHDISVMAHLLGTWPVGVQARGARHVQPHAEDVVFLGLRFPGGVLGQVHLSWLEPTKIRRISVVGEGGMVVFDDMAPEYKLEIHRATIPPPGPEPSELPEPARPRVAPRQPLREELRAFLRSVKTGRPFDTPGEDGVRVAQVLEAAERSLAEDGREIRVRIP